MPSLAVAERVDVQRLWPGSTIVCMASGPSLTSEDADYVRDVRASKLSESAGVRVIVVNTTYQLAPWADALYATDVIWWRAHKGAPEFRGLKFSIELSPGRRVRALQSWPEITVLRNTGQYGLELDPAGLKTGRHSGAAAIGLAYHLGASRIVLLGYDAKKTGDQSHWHGRHPSPLRNQGLYHLYLGGLEAMAEPLKAAGVEVVNCSPSTAVKAFPRKPLREVLM